MTENKNSIGMNELVDYKKKEYGSFMNWVMRFLWKCGGSDAQILQYAPYSDHIKCAGIGGVVLATTVMAMLAMGFAMSVVFDGKFYMIIPVAIIWGLIVFNLDRFIVSTVKGDGTEAITIIPKEGKPSELFSMLPRLAMAIIIGLTISAPLETYIFDKEIQREWRLSMDQLAIAKTYEVQQTETQKNSENEKDFTEISNRVEKQREIVLKWQKAFEEETSGIGGRGARGYGPEAQKMEAKMKEEEDKLKILETELKQKESKKIGNQEKIKNMKDSVLRETKSIKPGFLDKLMMIERLSSNGKSVPKADPLTGKPIKGSEVEIYGAAFWPIWLVRLLFMIVEIAPVIFKFMIWKTSYDYMQENVSQILEAKQGISLEYITDDKNNMHKVKENFNARRIAEVAKRQNELEKENAIHAITLYAEQEREKIEKDPESYIQPDSDNKES